MIFGGIALLIIVAGGLYFLNIQPSDPSMRDEILMKSVEENENDAMENSSDPSMGDSDTTMSDTAKEDSDTAMSDTAIENSAESRYAAYSQSFFDSASHKRRVLFFYAPWCPTCRPVDEEIQNNTSKIPEDVVIFRTDYDSEKELKDQYGITYQHTFVIVDENGNEMSKWNGGGFNEILDRLN